MTYTASMEQQNPRSEFVTHLKLAAMTFPSHLLSLLALVQLLQSFNYPRPIRPDSFQRPNFELVADVLCYFLQLIDCSISIHNDISTEDNRVEFINGVTAELAERLNLSLDGRRLYAADGFAVQELHKVARYIQIAMTLVNEESNDNIVIQHSTSESEIRASAIRAEILSQEIAEISANVKLLLNHEADDSKKRVKAINFLDAALSDDETSEKRSIKFSIEQILGETNDAVEILDKQCKMLISTNRGMEEKIRKRSIDIERNIKRLDSLTVQNIRPAFMDEYEQLESELQVEYEKYVVRIRNVDYLESELRSRGAAAISMTKKAEQYNRRMRRKFRADEMCALEGDSSDIDKVMQESSSLNRAFSSDGEGSAWEQEGSDVHEDVDGISRVEVLSSTISTPRNHASVSKSEGSLYDSFDSSFDITGSNMIDSISFNSEDNF